MTFLPPPVDKSRETGGRCRCRVLASSRNDDRCGGTGVDENENQDAGDRDAGSEGVIDAGAGRPLLDSLPGLVRRVRRRLGVSQRALAAQLGVSQSRVARWETGRTIPSAADLEEVLALIGASLVALDENGEQVRAMSPLAVRDLADRHYPAHCDPRGAGWWDPPGSMTTVEGAVEWRRSRELGVPRITYDRGVWRAMMRLGYGTPPDHPTTAEVVADLRAGEREHRRAS